MNWKERLFLSWLAPRGIVAAAVSSVFTLEIFHLAHASPNSEPMQILAEEAEILSPLVFLVIVGTVSVYGLTARLVARWLGIGEPRSHGRVVRGGRLRSRSKWL